MTNDTGSPSDESDHHPAAGGIVVYWRPGCGFCAALRFQLRRARIEYTGRNIRVDPDDAAFVRRHANGNETVPTVDVAGTVLVNPPLRDVLRAARAAGIEVPESHGPWWRREGRPPGS